MYLAIGLKLNFDVFCRSMGIPSAGNVVNLYEAKLATDRFSQGLHLLPKLTIEHIQPNSYSRMRVDLAAQVSDFWLVVWLFAADC